MSLLLTVTSPFWKSWVIGPSTHRPHGCFAAVSIEASALLLTGTVETPNAPAKRVATLRCGTLMRTLSTRGVNGATVWPEASVKEMHWEVVTGLVATPR